MAQRFYNLVLLPRVVEDLKFNKRLNYHLYQAIRCCCCFRCNPLLLLMLHLYRHKVEVGRSPGPAQQHATAARSSAHELSKQARAPYGLLLLLLLEAGTCSYAWAVLVLQCRRLVVSCCTPV
jgi:hypothetical protein